MKDSYLPTLLKLRLLVGFLGEKAQYNWWPTSFYEASGRLFLEPVFAKTARLAQYHGVLEAARRLHDEHLSVGSYHLFRLPEEVEQDLHALMLSDAGEGVSSLLSQGKEVALAALKQMAGSSSARGVGPTSVGSIQDLESSDTQQAIAAAYVSAFEEGAKTYPYLGS